MGGDGGTKSLQRKFIRSAQDKHSWKGWGVGGPGGVTSQAELARVRVSQCALTQKPLVQPIAADRLGNLFNKDDLVLALQAKAVEGAPLPSAFKHIRGLGDVTTLRLTPNPAAASGATRPGSSLAAASSSPASASSSSFSSGPATSRAAAVAAAAKTMQDLRMGGGADRPAPFMCPVTRLELNGRNRFVVVFQGGGEGPVLAERCLKRMSPTDLEADVGRAFAKEECVLLTPGEEEYAAMRRALAAEFKAAKARKKADKAAKKRKQLTGAVADGGSAAGAAGGAPGSAPPPAHHPSKRKTDGSEDAAGARAAVGDAGQAAGAEVVATASEGDSNNGDGDCGGGGGGGEGGERKKSKLSKQERRRAKEAKKAARQQQRQQNGAVATSLAYAGIGEEAEARAAKLKESNKTFASLFAREPTKSEREQQANLFIRVAGRMY